MIMNVKVFSKQKWLNIELQNLKKLLLNNRLDSAFVKINYIQRNIGWLDICDNLTHAEIVALGYVCDKSWLVKSQREVNDNE